MREKNDMLTIEMTIKHYQAVVQLCCSLHMIGNRHNSRAVFATTVFAKETKKLI